MEHYRHVGCSAVDHIQRCRRVVRARLQAADGWMKCHGVLLLQLATKSLERVGSVRASPAAQVPRLDYVGQSGVRHLQQLCGVVPSHRAVRTAAANDYNIARGWGRRVHAPLLRQHQTSASSRALCNTIQHHCEQCSTVKWPRTVSLKSWCCAMAIHCWTLHCRLMGRVAICSSVMCTFSLGCQASLGGLASSQTLRVLS